MTQLIEIVRLRRPNLKIHFFSGLDAAADWALGSPETRHNGVLIATNAEKLVRLYREPGLFDACKAPIYYPDGSGTLLLGSGRGCKLPGVELWLHILARADAQSLTVNIFGASSDVSRRAERLLRQRFPGTDLTCLDGFQSEDVYIRELENRRPEVVLVAMGSPRQETLIARLQSVHPDALFMGLGGSLDILTGEKKRAPSLFLALNVEFAYRLLKEPTRIWRQTALLRFLWLVLTRKFGAVVEP